MAVKNRLILRIDCAFDALRNGRSDTPMLTV
jgi:hypothetical protein